MMNNNFTQKYEILKRFLSGHRRGKIFENLYDHSLLTLKVLKKIKRKRGIIFNIRKLDKKHNDLLNSITEELIFLHDIGKVNSKSQKYYKGKIKKSELTTHSDISVILLIIIYYDYIKRLSNKELKEKNRKQDDILSEIILFFILSISFHHGDLTNFNSSNFIIYNKGKPKINKEKIRNIIENKKSIIEDSLKKLNINFDINNISTLFYKNILYSDELQELFFDIKLFYSLLVLSDYYATYIYTFNLSINRFKINVLDNKIKRTMRKNFFNVEYNKINFKEKEIIPPNKCNNLNEIRKNILIESSLNIKKALKKDYKIFMLEAPTGTGKTNVSLKLTLDIMEYDKKINRIFWVFPYVNIIEQNFKVIKKTFFRGEYEGCISNIFYNNINITEEKAEKYIEYDKNIATLMEYDLNESFLNNCINIISNVNFFNMILKSKHNYRYKFSNLFNSIVIIDEIQTLKPEYINIFYRILEILSNKYNIYFIIMSATLPNINFITEKKVAYNLINNPNNYFSNKILKRNKLEYLGLFNKEEELIEVIMKKIKNHKEKNKFLIVFNTIRDSIYFFKYIVKRMEEFNVLLLNSLISRDDKEKIISYIKNSKEKLILISTQSIEAGVDLDFDIGFRDMAIIDSIEQVSGRINRECSKKNNYLYIFKLNKRVEKIYKNDERLEILNNMGIKKMLKILSNKDFDSYYSKFIDKVKENRDNAIKYTYFEDIKNLNFMTINKLNLIEETGIITIARNKIDHKLLNKEIIKVLDNYNINSIKDLMRFKLSNNFFFNKPIRKLFNKIFNINSINIKLFNKDKFVEFAKISFLRDKFGDILILNDSFFEKYFKEYIIDRKKIKYLDILQLKEDIKNNKGDEVWFI